jgi:hypothetical protein
LSKSLFFISFYFLDRISRNKIVRNIEKKINNSKDLSKSHRELSQLNVEIMIARKRLNDARENLLRDKKIIESFEKDSK